LGKIITIFNKKGGVGKTSLAFSIAKDLDFHLLSNDDSIIEYIYEGRAKVMPNIKVVETENGVVYDLGGLISEGIIDVLKESDTVIVPTNLDSNSIKRTINTVLEMSPFCDDIIIVINRLTETLINKNKDSIGMLKGLNCDILLLNESAIIINSMNQGKTITELYEKTGLSRYNFITVFEQYSKILKRVQLRSDSTGIIGKGGVTKKKVGRPRQKNNELKRCAITSYVTESTAKKINALSEKTRVPKSTIISDLIDSHFKNK